MAIKYNGTTLKEIKYNGTTVKKIIYNKTTVYEVKTATEEFSYKWYPPATTTSIGHKALSVTLAHTPIKFTSVSCTDAVYASTFTITNNTSIKWKRPSSTGTNPSYTEVNSSLSGATVSFPETAGGSDSYPQTGTITFTYEYIA